jgi:hypothetical protein
MALGCGNSSDWSSDDSLGGPGMLGGLSDCPGSPTVVVEATQIPDLVWWIAGAWAVLMLIKGGGR